MTTVWACEKTVVMVKQPGHLTSMKKERGAGTSICAEKENKLALGARRVCACDLRKTVGAGGGATLVAGHSWSC